MLKPCFLEKMFSRDLFGSLSTKMNRKTELLALPQKREKIAKLWKINKRQIVISKVLLRLNVVRMDDATIVNVI